MLIVKHAQNTMDNSICLVLDDHSRVILKTAASDQGGYINANYIEASI